MPIEIQQLKKSILYNSISTVVYKISIFCTINIIVLILRLLTEVYFDYFDYSSNKGTKISKINIETWREKNKWNKILLHLLNLMTLISLAFGLVILASWLKELCIVWVKVFKNGPSNICGRQPLKIWNYMVCVSTGYI